MASLCSFDQAANRTGSFAPVTLLKIRHRAHNSEGNPKDRLAGPRLGPHAVDGGDVAVTGAVHVVKAGTQVVGYDGN